LIDAVYLWGAIEMNGAVIYTQAKPYLQDTKGIVGFSCGSSHVIVVESGGDVYALGSNEAFQLGFTA
jgi:alpha-tubulin suppressor-like RCC1 family protein